MRCLAILGLLMCSIYFVGAPPVTQKTETNKENPESFEQNLEYYRYFKEVIEVLDTDKEFRDKLMKMDESDIQTGKIAVELDFVNHNVRTKLDEIKRKELERLRHLATKQFELMNDIDTSHAKVNQHLGHVDHKNPHTFEIEDLRKLLTKAMDDINKADEERKEKFKEYEMQKEFDKQQKLNSLDDDGKKEFEKEIHDNEEKHKKHEPLHHPMSKQHVEEVWEQQDHMDKQALDLRSFFMMHGSKDQLQQVWKEQDHMDSDNFDPHAFFLFHDVDGNGYWDEIEVKALFLKELDKMYQNGAPEDDMWERREEMERMREHVFKEMDRDRDGLITYEEFLIQTRRAEWEKDKGWKGLDEQQVYSPEEYHEFEKRRVEELHRMQGMAPPHPGQYPSGHYPSGQMQPQYHPNAIPQPGQYPPNYHPGQAQHPQYQGQPQYYEGQQYQGHPQQAHPQQMQPQGHPQQMQPQGHPQQMQPQGHPQQMQPQGHPQQMQPQGHPQQMQPQGHPQQMQPHAHPQQAQQVQPPQVQQPQAQQPQVQQPQAQQPQVQQPQVQQAQAQPQVNQAQPQANVQGQPQKPEKVQPQAQGQVQNPPADLKRAQAENVH